MTIDTPARPGDLAAIGTVLAEDATTLDVRLVVPGQIRRAGRGPITLRLANVELEIVAAELLWVVTTNKGWVHMRGEAELVDGARLPFRADLYAAGHARDPGQDRLALRIYAAHDDPNRASPIHKIGGQMAPGSIRL